MIGAGVIISTEAYRANAYPADGSVNTPDSDGGAGTGLADEFKTLVDRRLNPKRPARNAERNSGMAATSKSNDNDGKPGASTSVSQTNADLGMQGIAADTKPLETADEPDSGDNGQSAKTIRMGVTLTSDLSLAVVSEGNKQHPDPPCISTTATEQDATATVAPDTNGSDEVATAVGQKLPTSGVPQQANSASECTDPPLCTSPSLVETTGIQVSTTSETGQNVLGTSVATVGDSMKSNKSSELSSRSSGRVQPRGTVDKASLVVDRDGESSTTLREGNRFVSVVGSTVPDTCLTESVASTDRVQQSTRGGALETVLHGISDQIVEFKRIGANSMAVLLKPDDKTEIYLNVKSQSGHIEVSARLNTGDADLLNSHWGEIKSSLAKQGIELSDLDTEETRPHYGSTWSGSRHSQSSDGQSENPQQRNTNRREVPEFLPKFKSLTNPLDTRWVAPAALAAAKRLWVMWI